MAERRITIVITRKHTWEDAFRFRATFEDLGVVLSARGSTVEEAYRNAKVLALQTMASQLEVEPIATDIFDTIIFVKVPPFPEPTKECEADGAYSP
jgi:predicted RNase H-like HicB family nuclease